MFSHVVYITTLHLSVTVTLRTEKLNLKRKNIENEYKKAKWRTGAISDVVKQTSHATTMRVHEKMRTHLRQGWLFRKNGTDSSTPVKIRSIKEIRF